MSRARRPSLLESSFPKKQSTGDPLDELHGLAEAAGAHVVGRILQRRDKPATATYFGSGKVDELAELVAATGADLILFDNELSPAQTRNLERAAGVKVLDRTELILDIFASHAQTYESRLAVELAQLEYALPRLKTNVDAPFSFENGNRYAWAG